MTKIWVIWQELTKRFPWNRVYRTHNHKFVFLIFYVLTSHASKQRVKTHLRWEVTSWKCKATTKTGSIYIIFLTATSKFSTSLCFRKQLQFEKRWNQYLLQQSYLVDIQIVSIMPNTSGADLQHPSILIFLSLTSGRRHLAHSFGMRPICHNPRKYQLQKLKKTTLNFS